jgi:hypothetical protein
MSAAFRWRKAVCSLLLSAIFLLNLLPWFGWTWHRVLPEHMHLFIGHGLARDEEMVPVPPPGERVVDPCLNCGAPQISSVVLHLPDGLTLQIAGIALVAAAVFAFVAPIGFQTDVIPEQILYQSPILPLVDPPPSSVFRCF